MNKLKPCPFCGDNKSITATSWRDIVDGSLVKIDKVYCKKHAFDITPVSWNTRPIEDKLQARIDALEAELATLREQNRWYLVSEPPDSGKIVYAYGFDGRGVAFYNAARSAWFWENQYREMTAHIKFWRELPAPPEE